MAELEVYLLGENICEQNKRFLESIAEKYGCLLHLIDSPDLKNDLSDVISRRWPLSAYIRLFAGELLPECVDRILYIDCDTIINRKLDILDEIDMGSRLFFGVKDCVSGSYKKNIGLGKNDIYINAGVLLMNLEELRKIPMGQKMRSFIETYRARITYADQDILNGIFSDRIGYLPLSCNVMTIVAEYSYKELCILRKPTDFYTEEEMIAAVRDPVIIHYTTNMRTVRPWYSNTNHPYADLFDKYRKLSPWSGRKLQIMRFGSIGSQMIGLLEKLPRRVSFPVLGFVHAFVRPFAVRWKK